MSNLRQGCQISRSNHSSCWWLVVILLGLAFSGLSRGQGVSILHSFPDGTVTGDGINPQSALVEDSSGNFYGTSLSGGSGWGCVFEMTSGGTVTILHSFGSVMDDGLSPVAGLVLASDGNLYGTTSGGGSGGQGTVFVITTGGTLTILHNFGDNSVANDGAVPSAGLIQGLDGNLYGTTSLGGLGAKGTVFEVTLPGYVTTIVHSFADGSVANDGASPASGLVQDASGNFYGTTPNGGASSRGVVYKINPQEQLSLLYSFSLPSTVSFNAGTPPSGPGGYTPNSRLALGTDGNLYGTTSASSYGYGTIYKITPQGVETVLHYFGSVANDGKEGTQGDELIEVGQDGNFYGTTAKGGSAGLGIVFEMTPAGQVTVLHNFGDGTVTNDGATPEGGVVEGADAKFYGTTNNGGAHGTGALFKLAPDVPEITSPLVASGPLNSPFNFHVVATQSPTSYSSTTLPPGLQIDPSSGLISGTPTVLGTTNVTLTVTNANGSSNTTIAITIVVRTVITSLLSDFASTTTSFYYQIRAYGLPTSFNATGLPDGLTVDQSTGLITGTPTVTGTFPVTLTATNAAGTDNETLTLVVSGSAPDFSQQYVQIHNFNDGTVSGEGVYPGPLSQAKDSTFFGMTAAGGGATTNTVFNLSSAGGARVFAASANLGTSTPEGIIQGTDGNFYGTTQNGGTQGMGSVFKVTPDGTVTVLHSFGDGSVTPDGANPAAGLVQSEDGNFYGTTQFGGGMANLGTIYKMDTSGNVTIMHSFQGDAQGDGAQPVAPLVDNGGTLYGTTQAGGVSVNTGNGTLDGGTVFVLYANGNYSTLHSFGDGSVSGDGLMPLAPLANLNGNLFGTTYDGGAYGNGTTFSISQSGSVVILHSFGNPAVTGDSSNPVGPAVAMTLPVIGTTIFGTTQNGGLGGDGAVYEINSDNNNAYTDLHDFGLTASDGVTPLGGLFLGVDGNIYGTTTAGGAGYGTFYAIVANAAPPASTTFPATYWILTGMLPPGMTFDSTTGTISGTPQSSDVPTNYVVSITPVVNGVTGSAQSFSLVVAQTFSQWSSQNSGGGLLTSSNYPDEIPNLLKYLCDISPSAPVSVSDHAALPTPGFDTTTTPGTTYLELTYRQFALETGVTVMVQTSSDLQTWTTVNPPAVFRQVGTDNTTSTHDPIMEIGVVASGKRQFIRLNLISQ